MSGISIDKLRPHPSNNLYFDDLAGDDWEAFLNDVRENGIRDPLRITTDFQVICGHQRLRAAKELGFQSVPVIIEDIQNIEDVERLLVEDNLHRRHLTPIQKAKLAATLKERWGVKAGNPQLRQNGGIGISKVADIIGESERTTQRLIKLNDLIPEFKKLVESKKLGQGFAEKLATLTPEEQSTLYKAFGDEIGKEAKAEAEKHIQQTIEYEKEQIEKKYKNAVPADQLDEAISDALERKDDEHAAYMKQKEKENEAQLKMREESLKAKFKEDLETERQKVDQLRSGYKRVKEELEGLKLQQPDDFDEKQAEAIKRKLQYEADINTVQLRVYIKNFLEKAAITSFMQGAIVSSNSSEKQRLAESVEMLEGFISQLKISLNGRKVVDKHGSS